MEEVRDHISRIYNEEERKVATLLLDMGFGFVGSNVVVQDYPGPVLGEIDLVFESDNILLLVEVGAGKKPSNKKWNFFGKWEDGPNVDALKKQLCMQSHETARVYFDLRMKPGNVGGPEASGITKPGSRNRICFQEDFDRLADGVKLGEVTRDDFLADFR